MAYGDFLVWATGTGDSDENESTVFHALIFDGEIMLNLNDLIPPGSGWVLWSAYAISGAGQIVGTGWHNNALCGFLLPPRRASVTS
jgi:hypothetical protein